MSESHVTLQDGRVLSAETEMIEVTLGGLFFDGPPPDPYRTFAPGITRYYLDGWPISEDEARETIRQNAGSTGG